MTSGYLVAELALKDLPTLSMCPGEKHDWAFLKLEPGMTREEGAGADYQRLVDQLEVSPMTFFKVWKLFRPLKIIALLAGFIILAGLGYLWYRHPDLTLPDNAWEWLKQSLTIGNVLTTLALMLLSVWLVNLAGRKAGVAMQVVRIRESLYRIVVGLSVGIVGWIGAFIHLHVFDRIFITLGRVK